MMRLKRDLEVKERFFEALGLHWINRSNSDFSPDERKPLREFTVQCSEEESLISRLTTERRYPGITVPGQADLLFAEVITFCPVPLPIWQNRARLVLEERVHLWRRQLARVHSSLDGSPVYTVPFGRFLLHEGAEQWVSGVLKCPVIPEQYFYEWHGKEGVQQDVYYFRRPFIVWPAKSADVSIVGVRLPGGTMLTLERPPLDHSLLSDDIQPKETEAEPARGLRSWLRNRF